MIAIAYKDVLPQQTIDTRVEKDLIFVGLVAMMDPPRKESKEAVENCIKAGIKPVMITGDHKITATAIAQQIGILKKIQMKPLKDMLSKDSQIKSYRKKVDDYSVYARVTPAQKIRIVKAWQDKGHVVAMTGGWRQ
ncbi:HAD family hydrolase [Lysinibacillus sp. MHQ-1]|nr:HAD family hydrolase [Lysinibacillus sp. MHQ-1]